MFYLIHIEMKITNGKSELMICLKNFNLPKCFFIRSYIHIRFTCISSFHVKQNLLKKNKRKVKTKTITISPCDSVKLVIETRFQEVIQSLRKKNEKWQQNGDDSLKTTNI